MKTLWIVLALGFVPAASGASSAEKKATVTVVNQSAWDLHHLFLSPVDKNEWGPDQLGKEVVGTGESFELQDVPCDLFDVRLIDEDGDECIVTDVDICGGSQRWEIKSGDLLECEGH